MILAVAIHHYLSRVWVFCARFPPREASILSCYTTLLEPLPKPLAEARRRRTPAPPPTPPSPDLTFDSWDPEFIRPFSFLSFSLFIALHVSLIQKQLGHGDSGSPAAASPAPASAPATPGNEEPDSEDSADLHPAERWSGLRWLSVSRGLKHVIWDESEARVRTACGRYLTGTPDTGLARALADRTEWHPACLDREPGLRAAVREWELS